MKEFETIRKEAEDCNTEYRVLCTRTRVPFYRGEVYRMSEISDGYYIYYKKRKYRAYSADRKQVYFEVRDGGEFVRYDKLDKALLDLIDEYY